MILILTNEGDVSTGQVMDWIDYLGGEAVRVNQESLFEFCHLNLTNNGKPSVVFKADGQPVDTAQVESYWYRRGDLNGKGSFNVSQLKELKHERIQHQINEHLDREVLELRRAVHKIIEDRPSIGSRAMSSINKLYTLMLAKNVGLDIPATIVATQKQALTDFKARFGDCITKGIQEGMTIQTTDNQQQEVQYGTYTTEVADELIEKEVTDQFFPSKFQEKLDKDYELRIFYLHGEFYAMAIFSQLDKQTSVDFRRYNFQHPNRNVPYQLPDDIAQKLDCLMRSAELDCGSIDMVVTKDERYVFLEVNPVGQFGMTSNPCNYYIERRIAQYLIQKNKATTHEKN